MHTFDISMDTKSSEQFIICLGDCSACEGCWIQVDLVEPTVVTGVITQGNGGQYHLNRVTEYQVAYQTDSSSALQYVTNADGSTKVCRDFNPKP